MFTSQELETILALFDMDSAMVAALERLRVPLAPERYAALANLKVRVGQELGKLAAAAEPSLPSPGDPEVAPEK